MPEKNSDNCKCSNEECFRRGDCKACKAYHERVGTKTGCQRAAAAADKR